MSKFRLTITERDRHIDIEGIEVDDRFDQNKVLITNIEDSVLAKSTRYRQVTRKVAWAFYINFRERLMLVGRAIIHNVGNTEFQIRQTIERHTRHIDRNLPHEERISEFQELIKSKPERIAKDLLFLEQRSIDLDAQLIGINIFLGKRFDAKFNKKHPMVPIMMRCLSPFHQALKDQGVSVNLSNLQDYQIITDFRLFNCAMYHFFDNLQKYVKPDTEVVISLDESNQVIIFDMCSCAFDEEESQRLFNEGYCGESAQAQKGEGLGMFIIALVLDKMDMKIIPEPNVKTRLGLDGIQYQDNRFYLKFSDKTVERIIK